MAPSSTSLSQLETRFILSNPLIHAISDQILVIPFLSNLLDPIPPVHTRLLDHSLDSRDLLMCCVSPHKGHPPYYQRELSRPHLVEMPYSKSSRPALCHQNHTQKNDFYNFVPTILLVPLLQQTLHSKQISQITPNPLDAWEHIPRTSCSMGIGESLSTSLLCQFLLHFGILNPFL